jgi:mRNA interferase RelE/StbE
MWQINYEAQATKFLKKADKATQIKILKYLQKTSQNPRLFGKALTGGLKGLWRYRVEDYRIICKLEDKELVILVINIGHRSVIYKTK